MLLSTRSVRLQHRAAPKTMRPISGSGPVTQEGAASPHSSPNPPHKREFGRGDSAEEHKLYSGAW